jgi:hypothetical protein
MTVKQIAQRLGVPVPYVDFTFSPQCAKCQITGGPEKPPCTPCRVEAFITVKEEPDDKRR